jgi:hypothetical protein
MASNLTCPIACLRRHVTQKHPPAVTEKSTLVTAAVINIACTVAVLEASATDGRNQVNTYHRSGTAFTNDQT